MKNFEFYTEFDDHDLVVEIDEPKAGLKGFIAIHRINENYPALGATRLWKYNCEEDALRDALRLSRLMSYKSAAAGLPYTGAKAALMADPAGLENRELFFRTYIEKVNELGGKFVTGTDVGLSDDDLKVMSDHSAFVIGYGVPAAYYTALSVLSGVKAGLREVFGNDDLSVRRFAIQGLGKTGFDLLKLLHSSGAKIFVADINETILERVKKEFPSILIVNQNDIHKQQVDVFCPCALSGSINNATIKELNCKIIAGAANNQLQDKKLGWELLERNILYAPDYICNAGGIISVVDQFENKIHDNDRILKKIDGLKKSLVSVFGEGKQKRQPTCMVADASFETIVSSKRNASNFMRPFEQLEEVYYKCRKNQPELNKRMLEAYHSVDGEEVANIYQNAVELKLIEKAEKKFLKYFHFIAERVPAYKDFLKKNKIDHEKILTPSDFHHIPWIDKKNYLEHYPFSSLCVDGRMEENQIVSVSSGSTGKPHFWPRGTLQEIETTMTFETAFQSILGLNRKKRTLLIQCFAQGMYIGGIFTINAGMRIACKGYKLILATPGNHKGEILRILTELRSEFSQIIIAGYSPLIKDVVDLAADASFPFSSTNIKFMFSGELVSESWRDMMCEAISADNVHTFAFNAYGTADAALLAHETPASIFVKRFCLSHPDVLDTILPHRDFSLVQYNPYLRYFEVDEGELIFSVMSGTPMIRYNIHDIGGIIPYSQTISLFADRGLDLDKEVLDQTLQKPWHLPFLYIYGRSDHTIVLHGANIYPENIKYALENSALADYASGKFVMQKIEDKNLKPIFDLHLELKNNIEPSDELNKKFRSIITENLRKINREYNVIYEYGDEVVGPHITLYPFGDKKHFSDDIKQRWVPRKTLSKQNNANECKPTIFFEGTYTAEDVLRFQADNSIKEVRDIYGQQMSELFEIRNPSLRHTAQYQGELEKFLCARQTCGSSGNWIYFPWNGIFVHTLTKDDYFRLRTNRNKNLITEEEQTALSQSTVAIAGLSVGSGIAVNLAYAGIASTLRLAEFDNLETTNLNRVRAGLADVGKSKSSITAHQVFEIDPYLNVQSFNEGLTGQNLSQFILSEPRPKVIFEIIDSFEIKIKMRLMAREAGIPVIMLANLGDSLLVDIERFDLNRNLSLFNGVIGDTPENILRNPDITEADKHKYAVELVGIENVPSRALASVREINNTLVGRPQLMSTVAVGGGIGAYLARKIILGETLKSGRKIMRFDDLFCNNS
ncbi:ThiF family adenylyltransferase [Patescibacteria group bacterium]|nr:ThiF family adenylyltransferase [Patescibacteria group bacterium]MBU1612852.1 ThiF family adenylyltransferase [Patescibacteria group bacterium]